MHTEKSKIIFSDYCTQEEIEYCKKKLKAKLFSTFCKLSKEGERYILTYWYTKVPLSKDSTSVQLTINAVIKDRQSDTEDMMRKIIPNLNQKTLFSTIATLFKLGNNHNKKIIGDMNMIVKCQRCGAVVPTATSSEVLLLKEEIRKKDEIIAGLQKDKEELMALVEKLQAQENIEMEKIAEEAIEPMADKVTNVETLEVNEEDIVEELPENAKVTETIIAEEVNIVPEEEKMEEPQEENEELNEEVVIEEPAPTEEEKVEAEMTEENNEVEEEKIEDATEMAPAPENPVEDNAVVEEAKEEEVIPSEELPAENQEILEENIPEQEAEEEKPEINEEENAEVELPKEEPVEEVKEEKEEDPYAIHTPITPIVRI